MRATGIGPSIEFRGKRYGMMDITPEMMGLVERRLEDGAWESVERTRGACSEQSYRDRLSAVAELIATKQFAIGSIAYQNFIRSTPGLKFTLYIQMKACDPEVTESLIEQLFLERQAEIMARMEAAKIPENPPGAASP